MAWMPPESDQVVQNTPERANSGWQPPESDSIVPTGNEKSVGGLARNAVSDAGNIISGTVGLAGNLIAHPIDTTKQVVTGLPAGLKAWAQELGVPEALHGQFGEALKKFGESAYEKPVSRALDVASVAMPALKATGVLKGADAAAMADKAAELGNAAEKAASARWTRAVGGTINNATELTRELGPVAGPEEFRRLGRLARNEGVVTPLNGVEDQAQKVAEMSSAAGKDIGALRDAADIQGQAAPLEDVLKQVQAKVGPSYDPAISTEGPEFERAMNRVRTTLPGEAAPDTFAERARRVTTLNEDAATKAKLLQASGATTDVANSLAHLNDEAIMKALTPEQGAKYQEALARFGDSKKLEQMVGQKAGYEAGASRNRISNNLFNRFQQRFGYQLTAAGMDKIASVLKTNPEKFGKYAHVLNAAMTGGPAALATTLHVLAQNDPNFSQTVQGISQ